MNILGGRLRQLREISGWNQSDFAAHLQRRGWDIDRAVLVRIESGKRTLTDVELQFILRVLKLDWSDLSRG